MEFKIFIPNFVPKQKSYKCNHYLSYELNIKHGKTSIFYRLMFPFEMQAFVLCLTGKRESNFSSFSLDREKR